ncbi:MAG: FAD-binding protein, partial [Bacteroidota bacterium]
MKIKKNYRWKNVAKDHRPRVKKYFLPTKLEDLIQIVKEAEANNMKVRAVGSGHSYSTVAVGSDYVVDLKNVNLVLPIKKKWLLDKQPLMFDDGQLLEIEAGISIQWLNKQLERKKLALINMGAVDDQTMAGAIATGTHGTGWNLPATPGMVRSITMVAHQGKVYKIEPKSKPVTNPATYDHPTIELIQDDDIFNSALLGLGCMGLIYSYIIEVRKEYWLKETKTPAFWADVKPKLEDLSLFEKNEKGEQVYRGISVLVNPYPNVKDKDHRCLIIRHRELDEKEKRSISASLPNLLGRIGGTLPIGYWIALQTLYDKPHKMPKLIDSAMGSIKDKEYIHKSHKVLHQGAELIKNKALSSEFAIPIKDPVRDFVTVTEALIKKSAALAREGMYISSPL